MSRDLAVIVVTWNVRDLVQTALRTLFDDLARSSLDASVYLVDSASSDDTVAVVRRDFPQVEVIASEENLGFARGNNEALRLIGFGGDTPTADLPRAVYLLNPDTATHPGATRTLFDTLMSDSNIGMVGAQLRYGDGSFQHSAFTFPGLRQLWVEFFPTPGRLIEGSFNGRYPRDVYKSGQPFPVDCVLGATMMLRREAIFATGIFDEQFFMYCEEIDWEWRIHEAGFRIMCVPSAQVTHYVGQSTGQVRPRSIINLWTSRLQLFAKHYPGWKQRIARWMIALGMSRLARKTAESEVKDAYSTIRRMALNTD